MVLEEIDQAGGKLLVIENTWLLPLSLHPASNGVSGLGILGTSAIVFCPTTHMQAAELVVFLPAGPCH